MAEALIAGVLRSGRSTAADIRVGEPNPARQSWLSQEYGVAVVADNNEVVAQADTVILAVKPQVWRQAVAPLQGHFRPQQLFISIVTGVPLAQLAELLPVGTPVVRVVPNTPCLIGQGISVLSPGPGVEAVSLERARQIFASVGETIVLAEELLNAATGLSGSGPGYVFLFVEALIDAGVRQGLPRAAARQMAAVTVAGAAGMVATSSRHPAELKDMVTSPGGTTMAGLEVLEKAGVRGAVMEAVAQAVKRAGELGE
ncbi:MAG: pyrroline-5-carboxylate reductase [Clostridia bacterium]|nr:MAG: pyrroline-5-carboxylate reductase [Clostridia bacterium]